MHAMLNILTNVSQVCLSGNLSDSHIGKNEADETMRQRDTVLCSLSSMVFTTGPRLLLDEIWWVCC